jgi:DNA invertase Pin-like site-specific DNA recombinase
MQNQEKLALVVRVSDVKGRDKKGDRFISPDEQVRDGTVYARSAGYEIQRFDDLNVSHTVPLDERPGMSAALKLIEAGKLAGIVVSSQDRLGTLTITRELKARLFAAGAVLKVADNPGAEQLDARGYAKLPTEYIALLHEAQREEIGLRWTKARRNAVERGVHPSTYVPIGYRRNTAEPRIGGPDRLSLTPEARWADPVVGQLVPNEWAPVIVQLFKLRAAGGSWTECCKLLEGCGVPNAKGEPFWIHSAVQRIIRNPVYKGTAYLRSQGKQAGDIINEEAHEPIVDPFLWKKAKPKQGKPRRTSEGALLAGILRCACCGRRLTPSGRHYRCRPRMVQGPPCDALANAPIAEVEALVMRDFLGAIAYRPTPPAPLDLEPFEKAVALGRAGEEQWKERAIAGASPEIALPAFEAAKARREEAEERLAEARAAAGLSDERATLAERWETMTVPERRRTLQAFGVEVLVKRGREPIANRIALMFNAEPYRGAATGDDFEPEIIVEHEFVEDEASPATKTAQ